MRYEIIDVDLVDIPSEFERVDSLVEDDALRKSIEKTGVQRPIAVLENGKRFELVKGGRRLVITRNLNRAKIPAMIDTVPDGVDRKAYRDRTRFILDESRQDLLPSQRAELIAELKTQFRMNNTQVAAYLGIDPGSVTNWLAVLAYEPEIRKAVDAGVITMHHARAFDGMTPEGQRAVYKARKRDFNKESGIGGGQLHELVRKEFSPDKFPQFYRDAEKLKERLARKSSPRKTKPRPAISAVQKERLHDSLELKETELREGQEEAKCMTQAITAATPIISAIMRNEDLLKHPAITDAMVLDFERFAEVYC